MLVSPGPQLQRAGVAVQKPTTRGMTQMKNTSIKVAALALGAALCASPLLAQVQGQNAAPGKGRKAGMSGKMHRGGQNTEARLARMAQHLNLTAAQQAQVKPVLEASHAQAKAVFQDQNLTREQKQAKLQEIRQATRTQMDTVLTAEQKEKLSQMRQQRPVRRGVQAAPGLI
jgi:periplasmic protein CpxP/Spy